MRLKLEVSNEQEKIGVSEVLGSLVFRAAEATLLSEEVDFDCELSLTYTDNDGIRTLNNEYRGKDAATDVLSFPMFDTAIEDICAVDGEFAVLGDVVISLERAAEQADTYGHSFEREVAFLCVHSVLHLLGYDHERSEDDDKLMREKQRNVMNALGLEIQ